MTEETSKCCASCTYFSPNTDRLTSAARVWCGDCTFVLPPFLVRVVEEANAGSFVRVDHTCSLWKEETK